MDLSSASPVRVRTRPQLLEELGGRAALDRALREGRWQRLMHGAYAEGADDVDLALRAAPARLLLPHRSLVADRCLLWLLGVDVLPPGPPVLEVVVPRGAVVPRRAGVRAREAALPRHDRVVLRGLPVLRPARAAVDLLRRLPLEEAVVVADAVQQADLVTERELGEELAQHAGLRGVRQAHLAVELSDGRAESPPETRLRLLLQRAGLRPVPQHEVRDAAGRLIARVDLALPAARVAVEYDGLEVHTARDAFVRDRQRQNALLGAGWLVLRYTAQDLRRRPHVVVDEVRRAAQRVA